MNPDALRPVAFQHVDDALLRIVESLEQVATTKITRNLEEQDFLERLIEGSKPGKLDGPLHYLLATPFRYPPLNHIQLSTVARRIRNCGTPWLMVIG